MTPRELAAHTKTAESHREFALDLYANIQAALHNGPLTREDKKPWTPAMFRPGVKQPEEVSGEPAWKRSLARAKEAAERMGKPQQASPEDAAQTVNYFEERSRRARAATERGEPREVIERIMSGVA